jgi:hypothetical protein
VANERLKSDSREIRFKERLGIDKEAKREGMKSDANEMRCTALGVGKNREEEERRERRCVGFSQYSVFY